jgi:hypothetical protein
VGCGGRVAGRPVRDEGSTTYVGAIESAEEFGRRIFTEAIRRGSQRAELIIILGDGAPWIWNLADEHFPGAIQIVDLYHAREHLNELAKILYGPGTPKAKAWAALRIVDLDAGEIDKLIGTMARLHPAAPAQRDALRRSIAYFQTNAPRMRYADFRRQGFFVGSGVIEAGCKTIAGRRLNQSGMRWTVRGANAIVALRCRKAVLRSALTSPLALSVPRVRVFVIAPGDPERRCPQGRPSPDRRAGWCSDRRCGAFRGFSHVGSRSRGGVIMSIRVKKVVVWRTEVENRPGEMARALEPLARQDLDLVIGYQGAVIDIAPVAGKKATAAAESAGFKPLPTSTILVEGDNRPGICFTAARALGDAGVSMDSVVVQVVGKKYQALFGFTSDADAKRAAILIKKAVEATKRNKRKEKK